MLYVTPARERMFKYTGTRKSNTQIEMYLLRNLTTQFEIHTNKSLRKR